MTGQIIGHYRILDQIGGGGMGVVFRAEDQRLGRQVALKLLPADLSESSEARERFRREAELISSLNHPHICTLHDVGEHEGRRFLVFELVDGHTLKQAIVGTPLPIDRAIASAIDIADALDAAHGKGVVHRDVKPGNIMLTSRGDAKLLDFGIAKREWRAATEDEATRADVTKRGEWVGTPDYMAPEQVRGETVDARADLFALGGVMYEMVTGRAPFRGDTVPATIEGVLHRAPSRPSALNPHVPEALERVILKALEKDRALRYQTAREIVADLRRIARDSTSAATPPAERARPPAARPWTVAIGVGVVLGLALAVWLLLSDRQSAGAPPSVAGGPSRLVVLPFENQTGQAADDWLAGAFSDAISAGLQPVDSLILVPRERVVELYAAESRRESQALSSELARQVSQKLRVRYYAHGSYQRVGEDLRVVAKLVDVEADAIQWSVTLTRPFVNVLALEDLLAERLAVRFGMPDPRLADGASEPRARVGQTSDLEALRWFTEAGTLYAQANFPAARPLLERAVARDPKYAAAWALLSKTYSRLGAPALAGSDAALTSTQPALDAATTAGSLAPDLVDAQVALALAYRGLSQRDRMLAAVERAMALAPRSGEPLILMGDLSSISPGYGCPVDAKPDVAEARYREGLHLDPLFTVSYGSLVTLLWWMGRPVDAMTATEEGLAAQPQNRNLRTWRPFNLAFADRLKEAEALLKDRTDTAPQDAFIRAIVALKGGRVAEADRFLRRADALLSQTLALTLITSVTEFQVGRPAEGGRYLARAVKAQPECSRWATQVPALAPYRDLPEFRKAIGAVK